MRAAAIPPLLLGLALLAPAIPAQGSVSQTRHNLSVSGPGPFKATVEQEICIFCHTPHGARSAAPLWNREDSRETYLTYSSSTTGAEVGQPTGASKLCLSCHDGSIALGSVISRADEIQMSSGHRFLDSGPGSIGTSLADDHPISFSYAASKGGSGLEYREENSIPPPVRLDAGGAVQCTSCHDPHRNLNGNFLHATDRHSAICLACHQPTGWSLASHANSTATWDGSGADPWPTANYATVAENGCANCHQNHAAGAPARLLVSPLEEQNCVNCHDGRVAALDVLRESSKISGHNPVLWQGVHDPAEDPLAMARHAECQDCHDPHEARAGAAAPPGLPGPLTGVDGVDSAGQRIARATAGYQVCYKCHADNNGGQAFLPRQVVQSNVRLEFDPGNPSFHPLEAPGANSFVPSLKPPLTTSSIIGCSDCHQSDNSPAAGGNGPAGPHGSNIRPLLLASYDTRDYVPESPSAYALCYRCHSRSSILGDQSFPEHRKHVLEEDAPCSACHDGHGIWSGQGNASNHSNLINFNLSQVAPSSSNGRLEFIDQGFRRGECSLRCHGEDHNPESYGP